MSARTLMTALLALTTLTACEGLSVRPGSVFANDDGDETVAFDDRLPLTFDAAVRTCMLTADRPTLRFEAGDQPALFDLCSPNSNSSLPTFEGDDLARFREGIGQVPMSSQERTVVALATPVLVAQAQAADVAPLPEVGFRDGVRRQRVTVATEKVWWFGEHTLGHWYCDVGYDVAVDFTGVNLADFTLGWYADEERETKGFEVALDFVDNRDVVVGRGEARLSACGFRLTNEWLLRYVDFDFALPVPARAAVAFSVDVEHLRVVGRGAPRVVDGRAELLWTVSADAQGVRIHDTLLPYVSTLDALLRLLPRVGVDAVGLAERLVADQMRSLFVDQLGPQFELLLNTATDKESGLIMPVAHKASGPAFRYFR